MPTQPKPDHAEPSADQTTVENSLRGRAVATTQALAASTGETARDLARRTSAGIETNPLSVLVGGVALGVLAGAVVPRSARETELLGPVGKRLTDTAKGAFDAARETAKSEFDVLGLTRAAARGQANKMLEGVLGAVAAAGAAALAGSRKQDAAPPPAAPPPAETADAE